MKKLCFFIEIINFIFFNIYYSETIIIKNNPNDNLNHNNLVKIDHEEKIIEPIQSPNNLIKSNKLKKLKSNKFNKMYCIWGGAGICLIIVMIIYFRKPTEPLEPPMNLTKQDLSWITTPYNHNSPEETIQRNLKKPIQDIFQGDKKQKTSYFQIHKYDNSSLDLIDFPKPTGPLQSPISLKEEDLQKTKRPYNHNSFEETIKDNLIKQIQDIFQDHQQKEISYGKKINEKELSSLENLWKTCNISHKNILIQYLNSIGATLGKHHKISKDSLYEFMNNFNYEDLRLNHIILMGIQSLKANDIFQYIGSHLTTIHCQGNSINILEKELILKFFTKFSLYNIDPYDYHSNNPIIFTLFPSPEDQIKILFDIFSIKSISEHRFFTLVKIYDETNILKLLDKIQKNDVKIIVKDRQRFNRGWQYSLRNKNIDRFKIDNIFSCIEYTL